MAGLAGKHASSLFESARKRGILEDMYRSVIRFLRCGKVDDDEVSQDFAEFMESLSEAQQNPVINRFLQLAQKELKIVEIEVVSAVPLSQDQMHRLECQFIVTVKKRIHINNVVDPGILGGLRIVIGTMAVDNSIKTQLSQMKEALYEGVYFSNENESL